MYKEVVNKVLLYGGESWVVTDVMLKALEGLHHGYSEYCRGNSLESHGGGMGVVISGGGLVVGGYVANKRVHSGATGYHCRVYG